MSDRAPSTVPAAPFVARIPAAFFGMVLGIGGLANGWRVAGSLWGWSRVIADALSLLAFGIWWLLVAAMILKWTRARAAALAEATNPVAGGFLALVPMSGMIATLAVFPLLGAFSKAVLAVALAALLTVLISAQIAFALWYVGRLWTGGRAAEATTPVLYLPTVGGSFVVAMSLAVLGFVDAGRMAFGVGMISWIVIEGMMWPRLLSQPLPVPLRATMGIHMAPPAVGLVAWTALHRGEGEAGAFAMALFGYALLQAAIMARMIPWLRQQPFGAPYWAYSFAVAALPLGAMRIVARGESERIVELLAPVLFALANLIIGAFLVGTVVRLAQGKYVPPLPGPTPAPAPAPTPAPAP